MRRSRLAYFDRIDDVIDPELRPLMPPRPRRNFELQSADIGTRRAEWTVGSQQMLTLAHGWHWPVVPFTFRSRVATGPPRRGAGRPVAREARCGRAPSPAATGAGTEGGRVRRGGGRRGGCVQRDSAVTIQGHHAGGGHRALHAVFPRGGFYALLAPAQHHRTVRRTQLAPE